MATTASIQIKGPATAFSRNWTVWWQWSHSQRRTYQPPARDSPASDSPHSRTSWLCIKLLNCLGIWFHPLCWCHPNEYIQVNLHKSVLSSPGTPCKLHSHNIVEPMTWKMWTKNNTLCTNILLLSFNHMITCQLVCTG